jgi:dihydroxyacetone kinase phosphoprotein-dependent L subunit
MADSVSLTDAGPIVDDLVAVIVREAPRLSALDGVIGDGDHGINLSKGFRRAAERLGDERDLARALDVVADTLQDEIGGSAGPIYGALFGAIAAELARSGTIDRQSFARALGTGIDAVRELGGAVPGDKTLIDVLVPALEAFQAAAARDEPFAACLAALCDAADSGLAATRDMTARLGRAARLGERSRGTLDPGAASCALLLTTLAQGLRVRLGDVSVDGGAR